MRKADPMNMKISSRDSKERFRPVVEELQGTWRARVYFGVEKIIWESSRSFSTDLEAYQIALDKVKELQQEGS